MSSDLNPIEALSPEDRALYFSSRNTHPDVLAVREKVARAFDKLHGTTPVSLSNAYEPGIVSHAPHAEGEHVNTTFLPGRMAGHWGTISQEMRDKGLDMTTLDAWSAWFKEVQGGNDTVRLIEEIGRLSDDPDYAVQGSRVNKRAQDLIARVDIAIEGEMLRRKGQRK